jgi:hypothetical protein
VSDQQDTVVGYPIPNQGKEHEPMSHPIAMRRKM